MSRVPYLALVLLLAGSIAGAEERALEPAPAPAPATEQCAWLDDEGPWSSLLQQWALTDSGNGRHGRVMNLPPGQNYYITDRVDGLMLPPPPPPSSYHGKQPNHPNFPGEPARPYDEWQHAPPAVSKIVNRPPNPYKDRFKPSHPGPPIIPVHSPPASVDRVDESKEPPKQMSETALYLLTAIEKLSYRADFMEKRLRKMEEAVHYLVAGVEVKPEPCVAEFMRVGAGCYHVSSQTADWKGAKHACRGLNAHMLEINTDQERRKLTSALLADKRYKGGDYWTGGLNPGLLWIWPHSAQEIITNSTQGDNSTVPVPQHVAIAGAGRCLAWVRDAAAGGFQYRGHDCGVAHRYICEADEDPARLARDVQRAARLLRDRASTKPPNTMP